MILKRLVLATQLRGALNTSRGAWKTRALVQQTRATASLHQPIIDTSREIEDQNKARPPSQIPGPRRWPIIGSYYSIVKHKDFAHDKMHMVWEACHKKYGPIFRLDTPGQSPTVFICLPEHVKQLATDHNIHPYFDIIAAVRNADEKNFVKGEAGVLATNGDAWLRMRRLVQGPTNKMKTVSHYLPKMDTVSQEFIEKMYGMRDENNELPENFLQQINGWALESLGLVTFGKRIGCIDGSKEGTDMVDTSHDYLSSIREAVLEPGSLWRWFKTPAYKKFERSHNKILAYVQEAIQKSMVSLEYKEKNNEELDLIEALLVTPKLKMTDINAYLTDFVAVGIDNTSSTLAFTLLNLARHPEKQAKVQEELDRVLGKNTDVLTPDQLAQLSYTKATVKETLRMNPVSFGIVRTMEKDIVLGGYRIPKGFIVFALTKFSGMMEEFFPRPNEFLPERWLRDRPMGAIDPYTSIPFGIGPRVCIGRRFAEQEMYTLLARTFHKYNLEWKYGDVGTRMILLLSPDKPLKFTITKRF